ncbi:hypothetical protein B0H66DRAFT_474618 [Apodospora peruviana]|uniref:BZIP domain-containing protein n=1 Tax=Apodospora peruviana TaxID=516989 RepID=A0AAE0IDQ2_9PEZI|nr:hypothetical protein B0H66DRAFT_474618 [Apodospora peruviana]
MSMSSASPASNAVGRPRTRQRIRKPADALAIPHIEEDAAERKRVLNILAQRRYRQRKRQLHQEVEPTRSGQETPPSVQGSNSTSTEEANVINLDTTQVLDSLTTGGPHLNPAADSQLDDLSFDDTWPANLEMADLSLLPDSEYDTNFNDDQSLSLFFQDINTTTNNTTTPQHPHDDNISSDSYLLQVNELTLLRALLRIAARLNSASTVWDMAANSPFNAGTGPFVTNLPPTWQPTPSQLNVPHHPVVDLLPWPRVRDRMISVMSLPDDMRPPVARDGPGPLALVNFIYDLEDGAEGVRIWGDDPFDDQSWEVGQVLFERWWFIFDKGVLESSNYLRRLRGAEKLRIITAGGDGYGIDEQVVT